MWHLRQLRSVIALPVQLVASGSMVAFGLAFLNPLTESFAQNRNYAVMASLADEAFYGCVFVAAGGLWILGLALGCGWLANVGAILTIFCRTTLFVLIGIGSNWQSPALSDFAFWVVLCCVADWRRSRGRSP